MGRAQRSQHVCPGQREPGWRKCADELKGKTRSWRNSLPGGFWARMRGTGLQMAVCPAWAHSLQCRCSETRADDPYVIEGCRRVLEASGNWNWGTCKGKTLGKRRFDLAAETGCRGTWEQSWRRGRRSASRERHVVRDEDKGDARLWRLDLEQRTAELGSRLRVLSGGVFAHYLQGNI